MDKLVIRGGQRLTGTVRVNGAKNAALPIMAAAILDQGGVTLRGVPPLRDTLTMRRILETLGVKNEIHPDGTISLHVADSRPKKAPYELVSTMRASICVMGPLLARRGRAIVSLPGGCNIGIRPIDLHLKGLKALGAKIRIQRGYIYASCPRLRGARIYLGGPYGSTVLGTCNVMMAATLAKGRTIIDAAACEPEVKDLASFLNRMGAKIRGAGSPRIEIEGVKHLSGADHRVIPDRIEATTFMTVAAVTKGRVTVENVHLGHLSAAVDLLRAMGVTVEPVGRRGCEVTRRKCLRPVDFATLPYPGIPTDAQAQLMALLAIARGISVVTEKIYPDRFMHVAELNRMGADIRKEGPSCIVNGVQKLSGAKVMASDLRASAALVLAGLVARGKTEISRIYHLDRGYHRIEERLATLGADIARVPDPDAGQTILR